MDRSGSKNIKHNNQAYRRSNRTKLSERNSIIHVRNGRFGSGVSAVLTQRDKLIGLYSCKFLPTETRYTTMEKEFFGIVKALQHFKTIIYNTHIMIETDRANLLFNTLIVNNQV
ncbi:hypothetical protein PAEPH01_2329 [Pancytospora epiphaga]|nr:hypothetical protein PAEPH01_2329 [Pancytospora epiphaga]